MPTQEVRSIRLKLMQLTLVGCRGKPRPASTRRRARTQWQSHLAIACGACKPKHLGSWLAKHLPDHNNFILGKSEISISIDELQELVEAKAGSGKWLSPTRERVDFGRTIGKYLDEDTGESSDTSIR
ncbi:MAG: hypothetical protein EBU85_05165, partial [Actinobacteria bacterium]|nr:hypothetical protein [Actinomycetota bacterium]